MGLGVKAQMMNLNQNSILKRKKNQRLNRKKVRREVNREKTEAASKLGSVAVG